MSLDFDNQQIVGYYPAEDAQSPKVQGNSSKYFGNCVLDDDDDGFNRVQNNHVNGNLSDMENDMYRYRRPKSKTIAKEKTRYFGLGGKE